MPGPYRLITVNVVMIHDGYIYLWSTLHDYVLWLHHSHLYHRKGAE
jgi:hypothetical protein